jgi:hypothetical protein
MRNEIVVEYRGNYVYAALYGKNSYEISLELWRRIMAACKQNNCFNILGENFTTTELSTMDAFNHLKILEEVGLTLQYRIAWVDEKTPTGKGLEFVETVVVKNRCLANGRLFSNIEDAKSWLLGKENEEQNV